MKLNTICQVTSSSKWPYFWLALPANCINMNLPCAAVATLTTPRHPLHICHGRCVSEGLHAGPLWSRQHHHPASNPRSRHTGNVSKRQWKIKLRQCKTPPIVHEMHYPKVIDVHRYWSFLPLDVDWAKEESVTQQTESQTPTDAWEDVFSRLVHSTISTETSRAATKALCKVACLPASHAIHCKG